MTSTNCAPYCHPLCIHCTPLIHALDQCWCDVCPTLKQRHLLTHWGARLRTYIRRCHKIYENSSNATLQLCTRATHTISFFDNWSASAIVPEYFFPAFFRFVSAWMHDPKAKM